MFLTKYIHPGTYFHFGLSRGILRSLSLINLKTIPGKIKICVSIDGIPFTKSSNSQFWPILAMIRGFNDSMPFIIGIYRGSAKPDSANDYLREFIKEAIKLENKWNHVSCHRVISCFHMQFPSKNICLMY